MPARPTFHIIPRRKIPRLIYSMLAASRSSAPVIVPSRPLDSWSIAALRKALGFGSQRQVPAAASSSQDGVLGNYSWCPIG